MHVLFLICTFLLEAVVAQGHKDVTPLKVIN